MPPCGRVASRNGRCSARACAVQLLEKAAASGALREIAGAPISHADDHRCCAMACALVRLSVKMEVNGENVENALAILLAQAQPLARLVAVLEARLVTLIWGSEVVVEQFPHASRSKGRASISP